MPCQVHATHSYPTEKQHAEADAQADEAVEAAGRAAAVTATLEHTDDLLDEIDSVLEVNAEEFVRSYIQKSGQ